MKRLIVLEGISGAGKSTLLAELNRATNFRDYHWHRFSATEWVYGTLNRRSIDLEKIRKYEEDVQRIWPTLLVTLTCDPYIALERKRHIPGEIIEPEIAIANKLFCVYHNYLTVIKNKIILNTSIKSVEECVETVLRRIETCNVLLSRT